MPVIFIRAILIFSILALYIWPPPIKHFRIFFSLLLIIICIGLATPIIKAKQFGVVSTTNGLISKIYVTNSSGMSFGSQELQCFNEILNTPQIGMDAASRLVVLRVDIIRSNYPENDKGQEIVKWYNVNFYTYFDLSLGEVKFNTTNYSCQF